MVGAEDYRTPVSEAEQYYSALKLQRVPTMLVKVPGAQPRRNRGAADAIGGQGCGDHRLVRQISFEAGPAQTAERAGN